MKEDSEKPFPVEEAAQPTGICSCPEELSVEGRLAMGILRVSSVNCNKMVTSCKGDFRV